MGLFSGNKTVFVDSDVLVIGGGMAGCGATYESRFWGRDKKVLVVEPPTNPGFGDATRR